MQGEGRKTCGELRLVDHRSSEDNLEERGGAKMGMRHADVTYAQARQYNSARQENCWEDGHGRRKLFSRANLLCS